MRNALSRIPLHFRTVTLRDGLQGWPKILSLQDKLKIYEAEKNAGFRDIEVGGISNLPQMSNSIEFYRFLQYMDNTSKHMLFFKAPQLEAALKQGFRGTVCGIVTPLEIFSKQNMNCSVEEGMKRVEGLANVAYANGLPMSVYVSGANGYPKTAGFPSTPSLPWDLEYMMQRLICMRSVEEAAISDTYGDMTPENLDYLISQIHPVMTDFIRLHLHDARGDGTTYKTFSKALEIGIRKFDGTILGLGGCPNACGADGKPISKGNANLRIMCDLAEQKGYKTGIDIERLVEAERVVKAVVHH